jgi:glycosyltransferase involved in cell wall biosynthesis
MPSIKFSIITVCRNPGEALQTTLASLWSQTYAGIEHIVIDGVSTDGTLEFLRRQKEKIAILISEPDKGIYDAMNKGVQQARGEYIFFLNAGDTFFDQTTLALVAETLVSDPVDILYGDAYIIDSVEKGYVRRHDQVDKVYLVTNTITHQAVFAKRKLFQEVGLFDLRFNIKADHDWIVRCWNAGKTFLYFPLTFVRYPNDGYSKVNRRKFIDAERTLFYRNNFSRPGILLFKIAYRLRLLQNRSGWIRSWMNKII